jgi:hypothetical protein
MRSQLSTSITVATGAGLYALLSASWFGWDPTFLVLCAIGVPASIYSFIRISRERRGGSLIDRLLEAMGYAPDGVPDKGRDRARVVLTLACRARSNSPSSMGDLLEVLNWEVLVKAFGRDALSPIHGRDIEAVRLRCKALPPQLAERFLGNNWSWSPVAAEGSTPA